jgi:hypothetical protein
MVGVLEIWPILEVKQRSPHQWKRRGKLPPADYPSVNGTEAWEVRTILTWADETGRLPESRQELFRATFEQEPRDHKRRGVWPTREPVDADEATQAPEATIVPPAPVAVSTVAANGTDPVFVEPRLKGDSKKRRSFRKPGVTA